MSEQHQIYILFGLWIITVICFIVRCENLQIDLDNNRKLTSNLYRGLQNYLNARNK